MIRKARLGAAALLVAMVMGACQAPTAPRSPNDRPEETPKPPAPPGDA